MKSFVRSVKNNVMNYDEAERLVREATNSDPWGASSTLMYKIVALTTDKEQYHAAMRMLWKRLTDMTNSQHVLKALLLTEFLLRNASERFVLDMKMRIRRFESLAQFSDFKNNQQVTKDVRSKANAVLHLLNDDEHRKEERKVAQRMREKMVGANSFNSNTTTGMSRGHTAAFQNQAYRSQASVGWQEHSQNHDATGSQTNGASTQIESDDDEQSFAKNKKHPKQASTKARKEAKKSRSLRREQEESWDHADDLDQSDSRNAAKKERKSNKKKNKMKKKAKTREEHTASPSPAAEDNNAVGFDAFYADAQQDLLEAAGPNNSSSNNEFLFSSAPAASGPALLDDLMGSFDSAQAPSPAAAASATATSGGAAEFLSGIDMQSNGGGGPAPVAAPDLFASPASGHLQQNYQQPHIQQQQQQHFQQQHLPQQHFQKLQQQQPFGQQHMHQQHFQQQHVQQQPFQQQPIDAFLRQSSAPPNPYWTGAQQKQQYEQMPVVQPMMIQKAPSKSEPQGPEKAVSDWNGQSGDLWELTKDLTSLDSMTTPKEEPKAPPQHTDSTWRDSPSYGLPPMQQQQKQQQQQQQQQPHQQMPFLFQQQQLQMDPRQYQQQQMDPRQYQQQQMDPRQYQQHQMQMDPRQYQQHMQQYQQQQQQQQMFSAQPHMM